MPDMNVELGQQEMKMLMDEREGFISWHKSSHCPKHVHGCFENVPIDKVRFVSEALRRTYTIEQGSGVWWLDNGDDSWSCEFITTPEHNQKPWSACGRTFLFVHWQEREEREAEISEEYEQGDSVVFSFGDTSWVGRVMERGEKATVYVGDFEHRRTMQVPWSLLRHYNAGDPLQYDDVRGH